MAFPFVNPQSLSLLNAAPYLSASEYQNAPTALDLTNLVQGGTAAQQVQSLVEIIARGSSAIDQFVFPDGTGGTLASSIDTDAAFVRCNPNGYFPLVCRFKPVIEVLSVSVGPYPGNMTDLPGTATVGMYVGPSMRTVYVPAAISPGITQVFGGNLVAGVAGQAFFEWSYVDGYPNTYLTADADAADTSLSVGSTLGMQPGTFLTIYDSWQAETVQVATVADSVAVTLAAPLTYAHTVPVAPDTMSVSALPPSVKQAAIFVTSALIKARGDNSFVLPDAGQTGTPVPTKDSSGYSDWQCAMDLLAPFKIVAGRAN